MNETSTVTRDSSGNISSNLSDSTVSPVSVLVGIFISVLAVATFLANIILISAIVKTSFLHTKTNVFLVCIASGEIITGTFVMPFSSLTFYDPNLTFSSRVCELIGFMTSLATSVKSLSLLSVSVDRCVAISYPLQYGNVITKRMVAFLVSIVWTISVLFATLPLLGVGNYTFMEYHKRCLLDYSTFPHFALTKEVVCVIVPSVIVIISLVIIVAEARSHHRVTAIAQLAIAMYTGPASTSGAKYARSTYRALRTFLIISIVYLLTCFPRSVYVAVAVGERTYSNTAFLVLTFLTYVCSLATPVVITTLNIKFRQSIKLLCQKQNKVRPYGEQTDAFTISTGLQSVLEASMAFSHVPPLEQVRKVTRESASHVTTRRVVTFQLRHVSVIPSVHHSNSIEIKEESETSHIHHAPLRKTLSYPT